MTMTRREKEAVRKRFEATETLPEARKRQCQQCGRPNPYWEHAGLCPECRRRRRPLNLSPAQLDQARRDLAHRDFLNRERAEALAKSARGAYIIGQALTLAIKHLETEEPRRREVSNIADMKLMRDHLFPLFHWAEEASEEYRDRLNELSETLRDSERLPPLPTDPR